MQHTFHQEVVKMPQKKKYDWNRLHKEFLSSGMTKKEFAEMKNISVYGIYKNFNRIEKSQAKITDCNSSAEEPAFVQVQLQEQQIPKQSELALEFKDFSIRVNENTDLKFLTKIIRTVLPLC